MTCLLDVSTLLAWLWADHEHHQRVIRWQKGKAIAVCPITELGFLRISTQPAFGATMEKVWFTLSTLHKKFSRNLSCVIKNSLSSRIRAFQRLERRHYYLAVPAENTDQLADAG